MKLREKTTATLMIAIFILASVFIAPAVAMGPKKSKGRKVIFVDNPKNEFDYYIIVSNRGWRQWRTDIDRFAICLFTDGMTQEAIDSHLAEGWSGPATIGTGDPRYEHVSPYVDGPVEIIWKYHDIGE